MKKRKMDAAKNPCEECIWCEDNGDGSQRICETCVPPDLEARRNEKSGNWGPLKEKSGE